ncbi:MAG: type II toxin-antitoxin system HigB family toxin [Hyphomicrobiales bacterium]
MKVISVERIEGFITKHKRGQEASGALRAWHKEMKAAAWRSPSELRGQYPNARPIGKGNGVTVFKIKGNHFRLVARINYQAEVIKIEFIGTHTEYDKIDVGEVAWKK